MSNFDPFLNSTTPSFGDPFSNMTPSPVQPQQINPQVSQPQQNVSPVQNTSNQQPYQQQYQNQQQNQGNNQQNKKDDLEEVLSLWKRVSNKGNEFLSGKDAQGNDYIAFYEYNKKNPKGPDLKVYRKKGQN